MMASAKHPFGKQISIVPRQHLPLVDGKTEARAQHKANRHNQAHDAGIVTLDFRDDQLQHRRLPRLRAEIASRVASDLIRADLGPVVLRRNQLNLDRTLRLRLRRRLTWLGCRGSGLRLGGLRRLLSCACAKSAMLAVRKTLAKPAAPKRFNEKDINFPFQ